MKTMFTALITSPASLPFITYLLQEVIKRVWEKYAMKWPNRLGPAVALGLGGLLGTLTLSDPTLGVLAGGAAAALHDLVSPRA